MEIDSVIVFTALCTRAAIRGGLSLQLAYNLNDYYVQSIEQCSSITELTNISHDMYEDFINRVHNLKLHPEISAPIRSCCYFIMLHIYDEIDLDTLAEKIGYSNYYLSRRFKNYGDIAQQLQEKVQDLMDVNYSFPHK